MSAIPNKLYSWPAQIIFWLVIIGLFLVFDLQELSFSKSAPLAILSSGFIIAVIYGNASWLIPAYFSRGRYLSYVAFLIALLIALTLIRTLIYDSIRSGFGWPHAPFGNSFFLGIITGVLSAIVSVFFRLSYDYIIIREEQANLRTEIAEAQLHLLYQQVQPHFLFNTLNNIYGVVRQTSPEGALLIDRLSSVIRYFLQDDQQRSVLLTEEIALVRSYIELEAIRLRYEMPVSFQTIGDIENIVVPRFLLLPLAENIFKHGVDKRSRENFATITININSSEILFVATNRLIPPLMPQSTTGTGLANLKKRLELFYGDKASMSILTTNGEFQITLMLPANNDLK